MLMDSRSSHNFVNTEIAKNQPCVQAIAAPLWVKVADGAISPCILEVRACEYQVQGYQFSSPLKLFPLGAYDIILGMEWLKFRGLITVDWRFDIIFVFMNIFFNLELFFKFLIFLKKILNIFPIHEHFF